MTDRAFLLRAIWSGDLARVLGGTGRDGSGRDLGSLVLDCWRAQECGSAITIDQVAMRFDLDRATTRRVLADLNVPHGEYVWPEKLRGALLTKAPGGASKVQSHEHTPS